jgi:hypothetical protein
LSYVLEELERVLERCAAKQTESSNTSNGSCGIRDAMHEIFIKIPLKKFLVNLAELVFWRILAPL